MLTDMSTEATGTYDKSAHLEMIQSVISRMSSNSFSVKTWSIGLVAALLALAGQPSTTPSPVLFRVATAAALLFALLDTAYLRQERLFRHLYEAVRHPEPKVSPYEMSTAHFRAARDAAWWRLPMSWSIWPLYLTLIGSCCALDRALTGAFW